MASIFKIIGQILVKSDGGFAKTAKDADKAAKSTDRANKATQSYTRQVKGASKQSSNASKNFSKMSQGLTGGLVPAYATLAANLFALSAAFEFFKRQSDLKALEETQKSFAATTGLAMRTVTGSLREASDGLLSFKEAAEAASIGLSKGLSGSQLEEFAEGARRAAAALGRDYEDTFSRLIRGVTKAEPELLDELGITLRLKDATEKYAVAIGKSVNQLTAYERSAAVAVEVQEQMEALFGELTVPTNPLVKLQKTFGEIIRQITDFLLPAVEAFANFLNRNIASAVVLFGAFAVSMFKSAFNLTGLTEGLHDFAKKAEKSYKKASKAVELYNNKIEQTRISRIESAAASEAEVMKYIRKQVAEGSKSAIFKEISDTGVITNQQKAVLQSATNANLKRFARGEQEATGIHKLESEERVKQFNKDLKNMNREHLTFSEQVISRTERKTLQMRKAFAGMRAAWVSGLRVMTTWAEIFLGVLNKLMLAATYVGVAVMAWDFAKLIGTKFVEWGAAAGFSFMRSFQKALDNKAAIQDLSNSLNNVRTDILGDFMDFARGSGVADPAKRLRFMMGLPLEDIQKDLRKLKAMTAEARDNFIGELLPITGQIWNSYFGGAATGDDAIKGMEDLIYLMETGIDRGNLLKTWTGKFWNDPGITTTQLVTPLLQKGVMSDEESLTKYVNRIGNALASYEDLVQMESQAPVEFGKSFTTEGAESFRVFLNEMRNQIDTAANDLKGIWPDVPEEYVYGLQEFNNEWNELLITLNRAHAAQKAIKNEAEKLAAMPKLAEGVFGVVTQKGFDIAMRELQYVNEMNKISQEITNARRIVEQGDPLSREKAQDTIDFLTYQQELMTAVEEHMQQMDSDVGRLKSTFRSTFEEGLVSGLEGVIKGTQSVGDAFRSMATSILESIAKVIAQILAMKIITGLNLDPFQSYTQTIPQGGTSFFASPVSRVTLASSGAILDGTVGGGMYGGIASGPKSGYPVTLHGTEAVVPLPNKKSIPVELKGDGGQMNNVTVNVSMSDTRVTSNAQSNSNMAENLGKAVAAAVQKELLSQKRPGGMLSKYGV